MNAQDSARRSNARVAALTRVSQVGGTAVSAPARAAFMAKFYDQVDPDRTLPIDEREKRATAARKAHFVALAARSVKSRQSKALREFAAEVIAVADEIDALAMVHSNDAKGVAS